MKFIKMIHSEGTMPIDVTGTGDFVTSEFGATIYYDFGLDDGVILNIKEQSFSPKDINDLIDFLKFAKEHLK